jgi:hypothetical protein
VFHVNREVARALADAFLGAPAWRVSVLVDRGRAVLSTEPSWLGRAAVAAVTSWPEPPVDAPGELARFLLGVDVGPEDEEARPEPPPRVVRRVPTPTRMGRTRWPVHPLHDLADVAELLGTDLEHLDWYAEGMYPAMQLDEECDSDGHVRRQGQDYYLKPMNCPMHNLVFDSRGRSYRELPLRLFEFGTVYRYEKSGVVHGLTRARGFTQDDAHIYCTPEQMAGELAALLDFVLGLLADYGLSDFYLELSTRKAAAAGYIRAWTGAVGARRAWAGGDGVRRGAGADGGPRSIDIPCGG